jgi:hypothetical protein
MLCVLSACGTKYGPNISGPPAFPVTGQVMVDGVPVQGVLVTMIPEEGVAEGRPAAGGFTDEAGEFTPTTYKPQDGAPAGKYRVMLSWIKIIDPTSNRDSQPPEAEQLPKKYQNPATSGITAEVEEGGGDLLPFEVSTKG